MGRIGMGPVFAQEWRAGSRNWQGYALRSLLVFLLLLGLWAAWEANLDGGEDPTIRQMAEAGRAFYAVTTLMLLGLVGLAAPAAAAGSICVDKARGNLLLLFATDLTAAEIVLGKLGARLAPVVGLTFCAAPVLALATLLGGVDPALPAGAMLVCLACGVFGCTLALTLSVWGRKTHEVLLATYAFGIGWLLAAPTWMVVSMNLPGWARPGWLPGYLALFPYNPIFLVLGPLGAPSALVAIGTGDQATFCGLGLLASALLAALATLRIRAVVVRQAGRGEAPRRGPGRWTLGRLLPSPSLDANPVLWREWHRRRPSGWSLVVWGLFGALSTGFGLWAIGDALRGGDGEVGSVFAALHVSAGLLLLSVPAATSLAEERRRGSLDVLMTTPLSTRSIVVGKWWGSFRGVPLLAIWPVLIATTLATRTGSAHGPALIGALIVAYGAAITSLGLAMATWTSRLERAVGLTAGLYLAVLIGAVPLAMGLFGEGPGAIGPGLASASPFWGVGFSTAAFSEGPARQDFGMQAAWLGVWILAYGLVAHGLLRATVATFDRCLGRMDSRRGPLTAPPASPSSPSPPAPGDSGGGPGPRPPRA